MKVEFEGGCEPLVPVGELAKDVFFVRQDGRICMRVALVSGAALSVVGDVPSVLAVDLSTAVIISLALGEHVWVRRGRVVLEGMPPR